MCPSPAVLEGHVSGAASGGPLGLGAALPLVRLGTETQICPCQCGTVCGVGGRGRRRAAWHAVSWHVFAAGVGAQALRVLRSHLEGVGQGL